MGDHFEVFIDNQVKTGRYNSASEVVRAALRLFEIEETKKEALIRALEKGEKSGFITDFDGEQFLQSLHDKYLTTKRG